MRVKCNFDPESVDLAEILQYGCKPPDASDMFKEGVFKKSGAHKGEGKSSRSDQMRCFRLKNHLLFYYQQDSLPILDKNVAGVIVLLNVFISRGLMTSTDDYPFVLRLSTDQQSKMKVYELRSKDIKQRDEWFEAIQSVILNPPVGGGTNPQGAAWPSSAKIAHCELISQGVRCPPSARLKPKSICDHHFLSLSFSEMHVKLLAQSNGVLESSAALQKWQEQIKGKGVQINILSSNSIFITLTKQLC
ncbi:uncharacterized protein LOC134855205 isoform X2 [Symsagittifera roscoffensis]|uniref:uncharacterized protein LOC134855205 isoform X2 n=1 Tax=Symsagittifera roscoffensis TaxID=84072 RepID=UPI00307C0E2F